MASNAGRCPVSRAAGARKDAALVMAAFATVAFPLTDMRVLRTGRGSELGNARIGGMLGVLGMTRSPSKRGRPCDNAVVESANKMLKAEFVYRESFGSLEEPQVELSDCVLWHDNERMRSALGYMSPIELREKPLTIPSKKVLPIQLVSRSSMASLHGDRQLFWS